MKSSILGFFLIILPFTASAKLCEQTWFHMAGVSKHVEVYEPSPYTKYRRQTHPGLGIECQNKQYTLAFGEFTNSLDRPFKYATASTDIAAVSDVRLFVGLLAGEYGLTVRDPLRMVAPIAYLEYQYKHVGLNFFALPPAKGFNDYAIFYTQFKIGF